MKKYLTSDRFKLACKSAALSASAIGATVAGIAVTHADYDMSGPALTATALTGFKAGVGDSVQSVSTTINNAYLMEMALGLIGLSIAFGVILYFVKGHRKI